MQNLNPRLMLALIVVSAGFGCSAPPADHPDMLHTPVPATLSQSGGPAGKNHGPIQAGLSPPVHLNPLATPLDKVVGSKVKD